MSHDLAMPNAPPTPVEDTELTSPIIDYSPSTVPYNEVFENALMTAILHPPETSDSGPATTTTSTITTTTTTTEVTKEKQPPPMISANQLPIPIDSPMRTHPSPLPGLYLTHPNGYHTGGIGPSPAIVRAFAEQLIREHRVEDAGQLERVVEGVMRERKEEVKRRMEKRERAVKRNRSVERQMEDLRLQHAAELRVMEKMKGARR